MRKYKNLTIIGTSHIAVQSIKEVEDNILKLKPDAVTLELDKARFDALVYNRRSKLRLRDIRKIGLKGFLFNLLGGFVENKLGKMVGVKPGSEMKKAVESAGKVGARIALIDQDIAITLRRLNDSLTFREKIRLLKDLFFGVLLEKNIKFDLRKVPENELIRKLTNKLKKRYPNVYRVLIEERNKFMAKRLYKIMNENKVVVAVVGAGHEEDIISEIKVLEKLL